MNLSTLRIWHGDQGSKSCENQIDDRLSRLESSSYMGEQEKIEEKFSDELLLELEVTELLWHAVIVNDLVSGVFPLDVTAQKKKRLIHEAMFYIWDEPYLFKQGICHDPTHGP